MPCRRSEVSSATKLRRPVRIAFAAVGFALYGWSMIAEDPLGPRLIAVGSVVIFVTLLLPLLTEFEFDVLGLKAKGAFKTRRQSVSMICEGETSDLESVLATIGVDREQVAGLIEEATEKTAQLWRGASDHELVRQLMICQALRLVLVSRRLGGPYRLDPTSALAAPNPGAADGDLALRRRMAAVLVSYAELPPCVVAGMLGLDRGDVDAAVADVAG